MKNWESFNKTLIISTTNINPHFLYICTQKVLCQIKTANKENLLRNITSFVGFHSSYNLQHMYFQNVSLFLLFAYEYPLHVYITINHQTKCQVILCHFITFR